MGIPPNGVPMLSEAAERAIGLEREGWKARSPLDGR